MTILLVTVATTVPVSVGWTVLFNYLLIRHRSGADVARRVVLEAPVLRWVFDRKKGVTS